jgi:hypothetical protein
MESKGTRGKEKRVKQHGGVGDIPKYINNSGMARGSPVKTATRRPANRRIPIARDRLDKIREVLGG